MESDILQKPEIPGFIVQSCFLDPMGGFARTCRQGAEAIRC